MAGFRLLLWKNAKRQVRRPYATTFEIGLPTLFFAILVIVRHITIDNQEQLCQHNQDGVLINATGEPNCDFDPISMDAIKYDKCNRIWEVAYAPNGSADLSTLAYEQLKNDVNMFDISVMPRGFRSNADIEAYYTRIEVDDIIPAGCRFRMSFDPDCVDPSCGSTGRHYGRISRTSFHSD